MESDAQTVPGPKMLLWAGRIVSALAVVAFVPSGVMKLMKTATVQEGFAQFGYPENVIVGLGIVELICTALYVIPRTSVLGAILLTGYLGGAVATHLRVGESYVPPIIVGVLVWGGLFLRDARLRELIPLRR